MRVRLSKSAIDRAPAPEKTEYWLGDTHVKGFGLRVWRSPNGSVKKTYAVRFRKRDGSYMRQTFYPFSALYDTWQDRKWRHYFDNNVSKHPERALKFEDITLGDILDKARSWAQDIIDLEHGRRLHGSADPKERIFSTLAEEEERHRSIIHGMISEFTLERMLGAHLKALKSDGSSQTYLDKLDRVFSLCIPRPLWNRKLIEIDPSEFQEAFLSIRKQSHLNVLRPLLRNLYEIARRHGVRGKTSEWDITDLETPDFGLDRDHHDDGDFWEKLFDRLEAEETLWQQAICLRLYFGLAPVPLNRLIGLRWDDLGIFRYPENEWSPERYEVEWRYGKQWWRKRRFESVELNSLLRAKNMGSIPLPYGSEYAI